MKRARYYEPSTGTFVDVLVAQPDAAQRGDGNPFLSYPGGC